MDGEGLEINGQTFGMGRCTSLLRNSLLSNQIVVKRPPFSITFICNIDKARKNLHAVAIKISVKEL